MSLMVLLIPYIFIALVIKECIELLLKSKFVKDLFNSKEDKNEKNK